MAATKARRPVGVKADTLVEQSIATAASKVRVNDLVTGGVTAAVLALGYVVLMMTLDRWLVLPNWVRQLSFGGFLIALASVVYFAIIVPFRRRVNPRYIARQVEQTIPDAKNVLINYVDLQDEELPGLVRAAVAAKAADELSEADVDTATHSKRVMWLAITAGVLVAVLAVLFLMFKWPQFSSLVSRAVNPFTDTAIASRTRIDLLDPTGGHATVMDGEQLNVAIGIGGAIPDPNGPFKPRLLVKYNPEATGYDEFPLVRGESSREFALMVPRSIIQNGFWYKVSAGDAVTDEYRVDVRTRPLLKGFEAKYVYPAYLKRDNAVAHDATIRGIRGTAVTLTIQTNRTVESGALVVSAGRTVETVRGEVTGPNRDSLRFKLSLVESGLYTVQFKPTTGEASFTSIQYPLDVEIDEKPVVKITAPKEKELVQPASSLLAVDAEITDDFGITAAALRFKLVGRNTVVIPAKKFRDGKSLAREKDGTFEKVLPDYKDSLTLDKLTDDKGQPLTLKADDVLEYWVEATDNCTEPRANVGKSKRMKVRIAPPPPMPDPKQQQQVDQRKAEEQKAQQNQQERQKNETRPPEESRDPDPNKQPEQPKEGEGQKGEQQKGEGQKGEGQKGEGQKGEDQKGEGQKGEQQQGEGQKGEGQKGGDSSDAKGGDPKQGEGSGGEKSNDKELQKQAETLKDKLNEKNSEPGEAKGDGDSTPKGSDAKPTQQSKPNDPMNQGGSEGAAEPKGGEKGGEPGENKAADRKDEGKLTPPEQAAEKAPPKDDGQGDQKPTGEQQKAGPKEGSDKAGESKGSPQDTGTQPNDPMNKGGEKSGEAGTAKGATPPQPGEQDPKNEQKLDSKEMEQAVRELDHENPGTREAARQKLDKAIGKENRETVERLNRDLKSGDPQKQQQAKKEIDELAKKAKPPEQQPGGESGQPDKSDAKHPDDMSGAKESGEPNRGQTKKEEKQPKGSGGADSKESRPDDKSGAGEAKGEKPGDPAASKEGEKKQGSGNDTKGPPQDASTEKAPPKAGPNDPMNPMKNEGDPAGSKGEGTKQANPTGSEGADDKATAKPSEPKTGTGKPNDQKAEGTKPDNKSNDQKAEGSKPDNKSNDQKGEGTKPDSTKPTAGGNDPKDPKSEKGGQGGNEQKLDPKEMEQAVRDLDSKDPDKRAAAQEKLDKAVGKQNREKAEQLNRDLKSDDPQKQQQAKREIDELAKNAGQQPSKELSEQEKKEIADAAKNLNSKNEADRKAAEQKLDQMVGKEKREELQKDLQDLQGDDPQKARQAREKLEKMIEEAKKQPGATSGDDPSKPGGPGSFTQKGQPIEDNLENRYKTADLNLKQFKELKDNPEFLKEAGYTPEQYDKFLKGYEEMVNRTREALDRERLNPTPEPALGPAQIKNDASGDRVKGREGGAVQGAGGVSVAPTGFSEAQRRFAEAAARRAAENEKQK